MRSDALARPILIDLCKDGTVTYRRKGERSFNNAALPVFSVKTIKEAQALQVHFCKLQYASHPLLPRQTGWYRISDFSGKIEDLYLMSNKFDDWYNEI